MEHGFVYYGAVPILGYLTAVMFCRILGFEHAGIYITASNDEYSMMHELPPGACMISVMISTCNMGVVAGSSRATESCAAERLSFSGTRSRGLKFMEHGFVYYGSMPFLGYPTAVMLLCVMAACSRCDAAFLF